MSNRIFLISGIAALGVAAIVMSGYVAGNLGNCHDFSQGSLHGEKTTLSVAIADSQVKQARGLSGCKQIPDKAGMYFPYTAYTTPTFWMKGMLIPIDIVWIRDGVIIGVDEYVPAPTGSLSQELPRYMPEKPVNAVLEVGAGKARTYGLLPGTKAEIQ